MEGEHERTRPEPSLYRRAQQGDPEALQQLVEHYRPWVEEIARRLISRLPLRSCEPQDLIQEAWEGFLRALRHYDPGRGPFEAFAKSAIKGAVIKGLSRCLGLSEAGRRAFPWVLRALDDLIRGGHLNPDPKQIRHKLEEWGHRISLETIEEVLTCLRPSLPILPGGPEDPELDNSWIDEEVLPGVEEPPGTPGDLEQIQGQWPDAQARKFVVLSIMREGMKLEWKEIAGRLQDGSPGWAQEWAECVREEYPNLLQEFPGLDDWAQVQERFSCPPPKRSPEALRQWYSRCRRALLAGRTGWRASLY